MVGLSCVMRLLSCTERLCKTSFNWSGSELKRWDQINWFWSGLS